MGEIFVEGLGLVEIEGDEPTPEEVQIIEENLLAGVGGQQQPPESRQVPEPEPEPPAPFMGRTGLVPPAGRAELRRAVEELPTFPQFMAEISPTMLGTAAGAGLGALTGPAAPIAIPLFAGAGGLLGEFIAQESGIAPPSKAALGLSATAPIGGVALGKALQIGRRTIGTTTKLPPIAAARARTVARQATGQFDSLGGRILAKQRGLMRQTSEALYGSARRVRVKIEVSQLQRTIGALGRLKRELSQVAAIPEAAQAIAFVNQSLEVLTQRGSARVSAVSFDTFIDLRQLIGRIIKRTERAGGFKLKTAKQTFKAMADDVDAIARKFSPARRGARLTQVAAKRAKLEFAIRDMERAAARFTSDVPGKDAVILNVKSFQKWLLDVTNPKSGLFDKNFSTALRKELPGIKVTLRDLAEATKAIGSPAGPGSIVIRGVGARSGRALIGGLIGFGTAGPIGAGVGGLAGATVPEMITALFMTRGGAALLTRMVKLGKGRLPTERWAILTQFLTRAAQVEPSSKKPPFGLTPLEARRRIQERDLGTPSE